MVDQQEYQRRLQNIIQQANQGNADAMYAMAVILSRQDIKKSLEWMDKAMAAGHSGAVYTLGAWYIQGTLIEPDYKKGHELLNQAAEMGSPDAEQLLASLSANGVGTPRDWQKALEIIIKAAKAGNTRALAQLAFLCFMEPGGGLKALGDDLLNLAAEGLDITAVYAYAKRTLNGETTNWDEDKAKTMMALAAQAGKHPLAMQDPVIQGVNAPRQPPLPTGDLDQIDWDKLQDGLKTPPVPEKLETETVSENPTIITFPGFMTEEETDYLIGMASRHLNPSQVVDPVSGKFIQDEYRTSSDMRFWPTLQDLVVYALLERISKATGEPVTHQEMLGVLKYEPGQQYKPHGDYLTADFEGKNAEVERSGQRIKTFLVYLNEDFEGGETEFVNIDIKTRGKKGDGLMFVNVTKNMQPNTLTIHAGRPITKGIKWLSTMWIREKEYRSR